MAHITLVGLREYPCRYYVRPAVTASAINRHLSELGDIKVCLWHGDARVGDLTPMGDLDGRTLTVAPDTEVSRWSPSDGTPQRRPRPRIPTRQSPTR